MNERIKTIADYYGKENQLQQLSEECCELSVEAHHHLRNRGTRSELAGEIADVLIMLEQIIYLEDFTDKEIEELKNEKISRQIRRIKNESEKIKIYK